MGKENIVNIYNGIWFRLKKEGNLAICDNMDGYSGYYAKQIPYGLTYMWNL